MIKKFNQFILEKNEFNGFSNIGEYIEHLANNDEYALNIISHYTQEIDPSIKLSNAINLLDNNTQKFILKSILDYKSKDEKEEDPEVIAYTSDNLIESTETLGGKNIFKCFLKIITALGQKDMKINWQNTPKDFIFYFLSNLIKVDDLKSVSSRYQYFDDFTNKIDYTNNDCKLFYGFRDNMTFEYGIITENEKIVTGQFKITKAILNWLMTLDSPSSINIKKELVSLNYNKIILISKIKNEMLKYKLGDDNTKIHFSIQGDILSFGYFGVGKWDNGKIDEGEIENVKSNFRNFLMQFKWSDKVQISITSNQFWLYLNIKLK